MPGWMPRQLHEVRWIGQLGRARDANTGQGAAHSKLGFACGDHNRSWLSIPALGVQNAGFDNGAL
jgi:hypothetical protein